MEQLRLGAAVCGSFCTFEKALAALKELAASEKYALTPIFSETAYSTDSRFGDAQGFIARLTFRGISRLLSLPSRMLRVVIRFLRRAAFVYFATRMTMTVFLRIRCVQVIMPMIGRACLL